MSDFDPTRLFLFGRDTVIPSPFPTYTKPRVLALSEADYLQDDDEIMVATVDDAVRGYPVKVVAPHHIVEDTLGGRPIAVTF
jgi:hypothetical protein